MTTALLIIFPVVLVITTVYEVWLLRRGRGSWQALVAGLLAFGGPTISVMVGEMQERESIERIASAVGIGGLIWYMLATRRRGRRPESGAGPDTNADVRSNPPHSM